MYYYDTETCGYHGPVVLLQYALDDGPIELHEVWRTPISETLAVIEKMMLHEGGVCGFNLTFDHFHLCQLYTTLTLLGSKVGLDALPDDHIEEYALCEPDARDGLCLKPVKSFDLMLHARKGPYQSTMDRKDIRVRRVPAVLAQALADELGERIPFKDIYFARKANKKERWKVYDIKDDLGRVVPEFCDVVLTFAPSSALKALAGDALNIDVDKILTFSDVDIPKEYRPLEYGYAPFALAVGTPDDWNGAWPDVIEHHINHWAFNSLARVYATDDVKYLQMLYDYFGRPEVDDDDSVLACMVGAVRWHGFRIDIPKVKALLDDRVMWLAKLPFNVNSVKIVREYLNEVLAPEERAIIAGSTKKIILEDLAKWTMESVCSCDGFDPKCEDCEGSGLLESTEKHPVAARAQFILDARSKIYEKGIFLKLIKAGRFHANLKVIGAKSSRMSGDGGLNAQGINKGEEIRSCFYLAFGDQVLMGGDFDGFEVVLMDAVYGDPELRAELLKGKKIHGLFGKYLFPGKSYEDILATKLLPEGKNLYSRSKNGVFAIAYGGEAYTLMHRVGISEEAANIAYNNWVKKYKVWGKERQRIFDLFCSMRQPGGLGSRVEWHDPAKYIESIFGFPRYFTLENKIVRVLFELGENPPKHWTKLKIKVVRRERTQTVAGAARSALFGAAFQVQASNMRAAGNHVIQASGAQLCKALQRRIWDIQPAGICGWRVMPLNVHDEVMCPTHPDYVDETIKVQRDFIKEHKDRVPLLSMGWERMTTWCEK